MEPVGPPEDATNDAGGNSAGLTPADQEAVEALEASVAQALFSFGQTLVMDDLQELGNEDA